MVAAPLTRNAVIKAVGEVDDSVVAGLVGMGVTAEELAQATSTPLGTVVIEVHLLPKGDARDAMRHQSELLHVLSTFGDDGVDCVVDCQRGTNR
jgi:hypothetical protein